MKIAIIGAGPGGLCAGIKLKEAGIDDFTIFDREDGVGGTWHSTRYPGLACDIKSHLYSFSFEPNPRWSCAYAAQPEILAYMNHCATKYGLRNHLRLSCSIASARWLDAENLWELQTEAGELVHADFLIAAQGMFNELKWPDIKGLDQFEGTVFHAARWNENYDLEGKRVAVVGTAASAVQFIPTIAPKVSQLHVFQRSPAWVMQKEDHICDEAEQAVLEADADKLKAVRSEYFDEVESFLTFSDPAVTDEMIGSALENLQKVNDPELRKRMTPDVPLGCLRPLFSNHYYQTFNRPNVELITDSIDHITSDGVVTADGTNRQVDAIIVATGYNVLKYLSAIDVTGQNDIHISDAWNDGAHAYLGIMTPNFPNLFMIYGPNTNNGSLLFMFECQVDFIVRHIAMMESKNMARISIKPQVSHDYNIWVQGVLDEVKAWQADCSNYYRTPSGRIVTQWPMGMSEYARRTAVLGDENMFELVAHG